MALPALAVLLACLFPAGAAAQQTEAIPRLVGDLRGALVGLPTAPGWTPTVATGDQVPSRALGLDAGAHVNFAHLNSFTLGLGATFLTGRSTATTVRATAPGTSAGGIPQEVSTRLTTVAPQLSLNFGHRLGWSYVSGGVGAAKVSSEARVAATTGVAREVAGEWSRSLNVGGGARWFVNDRVGVGFDLRWHQLGGVSAMSLRDAAPRETLLSISVGLSLQ